MRAYYNEFKPEAAHMLRQLITDGLIAPGVVDERSITEVDPDEIKRFTQCHFFAGIGGWSVALRLAGWPDDQPVWTGSCPCQPFSSAGKQKGKADDRHLWPVWNRIIEECRPPVIFGEQVAQAVAHGWWDETASDLERKGYACGAAVLPAHSVGALHQRDRLWFVAEHPHTHSFGSQGRIDQKIWEGGLQQFERLVQSQLQFSVPTGKGGGLVDGVQYRTPLLHALGNAIVPQVAAAFIESYRQILIESISIDQYL